MGNKNDLKIEKVFYEKSFHKNEIRGHDQLLQLSQKVRRLEVTQVGIFNFAKIAATTCFHVRFALVENALRFCFKGEQDLRRDV